MTLETLKWQCYNVHLLIIQYVIHIHYHNTLTESIN